MTKRERVRKTLLGEPTDRPPVALWRHFYHREGSADALASSMLGFHREFDWDLLKINPRGSYHVEDWGVRTERPGTGPLDKPKKVAGVVKRPEDWDKIRRSIRRAAFWGSISTRRNGSRRRSKGTRTGS